MTCFPFLDYGTFFTRRAMSIPPSSCGGLEYTETMAFRETSRGLLRNNETKILTHSRTPIELALRFFWKDHSRSGPFTIEDMQVKVRDGLECTQECTTVSYLRERLD
jgi:hypothetical protein